MLIWVSSGSGDLLLAAGPGNQTIFGGNADPTAIFASSNDIFVLYGVTNLTAAGFL